MWLDIKSAPKERRILLAAPSAPLGMCFAEWDATLPYPAFCNDIGDSVFDATHWAELTAPAKAIEARSGETERLDPQGESAVRQDLPKE